MHWLQVLAGGASLTVILSGVVALLGKFIKNVVVSGIREETAPIRADILALQLKLAAETGGNSHGLRQKLDEVSDDLAELRGEVRAIHPND